MSVQAKREIKILLSMTDPGRDPEKRRVIQIDPSRIPASVPRVFLPHEHVEGAHHRQDTPAIVALYGEVCEPPVYESGTLVGVAWRITVWPYIPAILRELNDEPTRRSLFAPLLKAISAHVPQNRAWWRVYACNAQIGQPVGEDPFFEADFSSFGKPQEEKNDQLMRDWLYLPRAYNRLARSQGWQERFPSGYVQDHWNTDEQIYWDIYGHLQTRAGAIAAHLWDTWMSDATYRSHLRRQEIQFPVDVNQMTRYDNGKHQPLFTGFDKATQYFSGPSRFARRPAAGKR